MSDSKQLVKMDDLIKYYDGIKVLKGLNIEINSGHIIGLIGPNSGGKSTLLKHLIGLNLPSSGSCRTFGVSTEKLSEQELARIGYVHQEGELYSWMTARQAIDYVASHYLTWNKSLEAKFIALFEIELVGKIANFSPGQRQKLSILLAVCYEPELLILDEPASALDPIARKQFLELLIDIIQDQKSTIIISSHILSDIEKVIDKVMILDKGRLLRDCDFDDLLEEFNDSSKGSGLSLEEIYPLVLSSKVTTINS